MQKITKGYPNWDVPYNENVEEYNNTIGNVELDTEDKTIKGAINEVKDKLDDIKENEQINAADISNLKTNVATNTSQLKDMANNKEDKIYDSGWLDLIPSKGNTTTGFNLQYRRIGNRVQIHGRITGLTSTGTFALLPVGFRPSKKQEVFTSPCSGMVWAKIIVFQSGEISITGVSNDNLVASQDICLNQLSYLVD